MTDTRDDRQARDIRELTLAEVATSRRLLVLIAVLVVIAVGALVFFFLGPGRDQGGTGNQRTCSKSAAYSCDDFRDPKGGG